MGPLIFYSTLLMLSMNVCLHFPREPFPKQLVIAFGGSQLVALLLGWRPPLLVDWLIFATFVVGWVLATRLREALLPFLFLWGIGTEICRSIIAQIWMVHASRSVVLAGWLGGQVGASAQANSLPFVLACVVLGSMAGSFGPILAYGSLHKLLDKPTAHVFPILLFGLWLFYDEFTVPANAPHLDLAKVEFAFYAAFARIAVDALVGMRQQQQQQHQHAKTQ